MAEVIGVIASGIAIGQATTAIASSLLKLKEFCGQIKDSGDDLTHLLHEIEITYLVLAESEGQEQLTHYASSSKSFQRVLDLTKDAAQELEVLVIDLETRVKQCCGWRRQIATAKAVLKKDQIKRYKSRLKRCLRLLTVAQNFKISVMLENQPALLSQELTKMTRESETTSDENAEEYNVSPSDIHIGGANLKARNLDQIPAFQIRLHLFHRLWHIYSHRSQAGWDFGLRVFHHMPSESRLALLVANDMVEPIREMFSTGQASPLTVIRSFNGQDLSLLAYSVRYGSLGVCQLLLNEGSKFIEGSIDSKNSPLMELVGSTSFYLRYTAERGIPRQKRLDLISTIIFGDRELSSSYDTNSLLNDLGLLKNFWGTLSLFQRIQTALLPDYYTLPAEVRADIAMKVLMLNISTPDLFWVVLGNSFKSSDLNKAYSISAYWQLPSTLLCQAVFRLGRSLFELGYTPSDDEICADLYMHPVHSQYGVRQLALCASNYPFRGWKAVVNQLLVHGADPNLPSFLGTPLFGVIYGAYSLDFVGASVFEEAFHVTEVSRFFLHKKDPNRGKKALYAWLETLKLAGVDLMEYGKMEKRVQKAYGLGDINMSSVPLYTTKRKIYLHLISMEIGPEPEDWKFWFSELTDQFAGEFWEMIEHPERSMPGAWDEFSW